MLVKRNSLISKEDSIQEEEVVKKPLFSDIEIKTYKQEVLETLAILEKQNINIYDTDRKGGMYLKNHITNDDKISPSLKKHFASNESSTEQKQNIDNLINFFNNNK